MDMGKLGVAMQTVEDRLKHIAALVLGRAGNERLMEIDQESIDYDPESMCLCFKGHFKYVVGNEPAEFGVRFPMTFFRKDSTDGEILAWLERNA